MNSLVPSTSAAISSLNPTVSSNALSRFRLIKVWSKNLVERHPQDPYWYYIEKRRTFWKWTWWSKISRYSYREDAAKAFKTMVAKEKPIALEVLQEE